MRACAIGQIDGTASRPLPIASPFSLSLLRCSTFNSCRIVTQSIDAMHEVWPRAGALGMGSFWPVVRVGVDDFLSVPFLPCACKGDLFCQSNLPRRPRW